MATILSRDGSTYTVTYTEGGEEKFKEKYGDRKTARAYYEGGKTLTVQGGSGETPTQPEPSGTEPPPPSDALKQRYIEGAYRGTQRDVNAYSWATPLDRSVALMKAERNANLTVRERFADARLSRTREQSARLKQVEPSPPKTFGQKAISLGGSALDWTVDTLGSPLFAGGKIARGIINTMSSDLQQGNIPLLHGKSYTVEVRPQVRDFFSGVGADLGEKYPTASGLAKKGYDYVETRTRPPQSGTELLLDRHILTTATFYGGSVVWASGKAGQWALAGASAVGTYFAGKEAVKNPTGANVARTVFTAVPMLAKGKQFIGNFIVRLGARESPASQVLSPEGMQGQLTKTSSVEATITRFKATVGRKEYAVEYLSSGEVTTYAPTMRGTYIGFGQGRKNVIIGGEKGAKGIEDYGRFITSYGRGSALRLGDANTYKPSVNPIKGVVSLFRGGRPSAVNFSLTGGIGRYSENQLSGSFARSNVWLLKQSGSGKAFITKRSERYFKGKRSGATSEEEAVIPHGTKLENTYPFGGGVRGFIARLKGYDEYFRYEGQNIPIINKATVETSAPTSVIGRAFNNVRVRLQGRSSYSTSQYSPPTLGGFYSFSPRQSSPYSLGFGGSLFQTYPLSSLFGGVSYGGSRALSFGQSYPTRSKRRFTPSYARFSYAGGYSIGGRLSLSYGVPVSFGGSSRNLLSPPYSPPSQPPKGKIKPKRERGGISESLGVTVKVPYKTGYAPSVEASALGIKGGSRRGFRTGLTFRPL